MEFHGSWGCVCKSLCMALCVKINIPPWKNQKCSLPALKPHHAAGISSSEVVWHTLQQYSSCHAAPESFRTRMAQKVRDLSPVCWGKQQMLRVGIMFSIELFCVLKSNPKWLGWIYSGDDVASTADKYLVMEISGSNWETSVCMFRHFLGLNA